VGAYVFIAGMVIVIFVVDGVWRWWRLNAWRYRRRDDDEG